ncbi:hypothetical protein ACUOFC_26250, partial [Escherichia sp. TWPC-MK]
MRFAAFFSRASIHSTLGTFVFTQNGWVQSYGSRCVKPPIVIGD